MLLALSTASKAGNPALTPVSNSPYCNNKGVSY